MPIRKYNPTSPGRRFQTVQVFENIKIALASVGADDRPAPFIAKLGIGRSIVLVAGSLALHGALFCEPSPAPTKWALSRLGRGANAMRLPITPLGAAGQARVEQAMREAGVL